MAKFVTHIVSAFCFCFLLFLNTLLFLVFRLVGSSCVMSSTFPQYILAFRMTVCHQTARKQQSHAKCSLWKPECIIAWVPSQVT